MTAMLGDAASAFTDGLQRIDDIDVRDGGILLDLNMPVDPNGVVYDSVSRVPVRGATVALVDIRNGQPLPGACFDDPNQQNQVTLSNGYYKFDLNFSDPACPSGMNYLIEITPPNANFVSGRSEMIPPVSSEATLPQFWADNEESILRYIEAAHIGLRGQVTDADSGLPLHARVRVLHNAQPVFTAPDTGDYFRMLLPLCTTLTHTSGLPMKMENSSAWAS